MSGAAAPLVVGVDGGGSKTVLVAATEAAEVVAVLRESGINPFDSSDWQAVLARLNAEMVTALGPAVTDIHHAAFGMPGYGEVAAVSAAQQAAAAGFGLPSWSVLNDVEAAFEAAFAGRPGVLLLAGTGSMVWARSALGRDVRVGGWGEAIGDEGSAFWIGHELVGAASRAVDGRIEAPGLADALFHHLGLDREQPQEALIGWRAANPHPRSAVAALARLADALAEAGDAVALAIMRSAADHLALHVLAAWRLIARGESRDDEAAGRLDWSHAGGLFGSRILGEGVAARLGVPPVEPALPPVGGALLRAARAAGWQADSRWVDQLAASLADHGIRR